MDAHIFRIDGQVHVIVSARSRIRRGRGHRAICGVPIDHDAQRFAPFGIHDDRQSPAISCDSCMDSFIGFVDSVDMDFGFPGQSDFGRSS